MTIFLLTTFSKKILLPIKLVANTVFIGIPIKPDPAEDNATEVDFVAKIFNVSINFNSVDNLIFSKFFSHFFVIVFEVGYHSLLLFTE